jgi:hypothetical protein
MLRVERQWTLSEKQGGWAFSWDMSTDFTMDDVCWWIFGFLCSAVLLSVCMVMAMMITGLFAVDASVVGERSQFLFAGLPWARFRLDSFRLFRQLRNEWHDRKRRLELGPPLLVFARSTSIVMYSLASLIITQRSEHCIVAR